MALFGCFMFLFAFVFVSFYLIRTIIRFSVLLRGKEVGFNRFS